MSRFIPRYRVDPNSTGFLREEADGSLTPGRFVGGVFVVSKPPLAPTPREPKFPTEAEHVLPF